MKPKKPFLLLAITFMLAGVARADLIPITFSGAAQWAIEVVSLGAGNFSEQPNQEAPAGITFSYDTAAAPVSAAGSAINGTRATDAAYFMGTSFSVNGLNSSPGKSAELDGMRAPYANLQNVDMVTDAPGQQLKQLAFSVLVDGAGRPLVQERIAHALLNASSDRNPLAFAVQNEAESDKGAPASEFAGALRAAISNCAKPITALLQVQGAILEAATQARHTELMNAATGQMALLDMLQPWMERRLLWAVATLILATLLSPHVQNQVKTIRRIGKVADIAIVMPAEANHDSTEADQASIEVIRDSSEVTQSSMDLNCAQCDGEKDTSIQSVQEEGGALTVPAVMSACEEISDRDHRERRHRGQLVQRNIIRRARCSHRRQWRYHYERREHRFSHRERCHCVRQKRRSRSSGCTGNFPATQASSLSLSHAENGTGATGNLPDICSTTF